MKIIERRNGRVEYYPTKGCRFVRKDRTETYPWFLVLKPGDSIDNYEDLPEDEVIQIETILNERKGIQCAQIEEICQECQEKNQ